MWKNSSSIIDKKMLTGNEIREKFIEFFMQKGKVLIEGTPYEIANDPLAKKVYLGEKFRLD